MFSAHCMSAIAVGVLCTSCSRSCQCCCVSEMGEGGIGLGQLCTDEGMAAEWQLVTCVTGVIMSAACTLCLLLLASRILATEKAVKERICEEPPMLPTPCLPLLHGSSNMHCKQVVRVTLSVPYLLRTLIRACQASTKIIPAHSLQIQVDETQEAHPNFDSLNRTAGTLAQQETLHNFSCKTCALCRVYSAH